MDLWNEQEAFIAILQDGKYDIFTFPLYRLLSYQNGITKVLTFSLFRQMDYNDNRGKNFILIHYSSL